MKYIDLKGTLRENLGKNGSRKIRTNGDIPCILYGEKGTVYFSVSAKEFKEVIYTHEVYLVNLDIDGKKYEAKIQDLQFNPIEDTVSHVDFLSIDKNKQIKVDLPVRSFGNSVGVREGGKLVLVLRKLTVKGLVKDLPEDIQVDISDLGLGKSLRVGDISVKNIDILNIKSNPVISVRATRQSRAAETTEKK